MPFLPPNHVKALKATSAVKNWKNKNKLYNIDKTTTTTTHLMAFSQIDSDEPAPEKHSLTYTLSL